MRRIGLDSGVVFSGGDAGSSRGRGIGTRAVAGAGAGNRWKRRHGKNRSVSGLTGDSADADSAGDRSRCHGADCPIVDCRSVEAGRKGRTVNLLLNEIPDFRAALDPPIRGREDRCAVLHREQVDRRVRRGREATRRRACAIRIRAASNRPQIAGATVSHGSAGSCSELEGLGASAAPVDWITAAEIRRPTTLRIVIGGPLAPSPADNRVV